MIHLWILIAAVAGVGWLWLDLRAARRGRIRRSALDALAWYDEDNKL